MFSSRNIGDKNFIYHVFVGVISKKCGVFEGDFFFSLVYTNYKTEKKISIGLQESWPFLSGKLVSLGIISLGIIVGVFGLFGLVKNLKIKKQG